MPRKRSYADNVERALQQALAELHSQRDDIEKAIDQVEATLSRLGKRAASFVRQVEKRSRNWSAAARQAARDRMKKYWADRRKASASAAGVSPKKKAPAKRRKKASKAKSASKSAAATQQA